MFLTAEIKSGLFEGWRQWHLVALSVAIIAVIVVFIWYWMGDKEEFHPRNMAVRETSRGQTFPILADRADSPPFTQGTGKGLDAVKMRLGRTALFPRGELTDVSGIKKENAYFPEDMGLHMGSDALAPMRAIGRKKTPALKKEGMVAPKKDTLGAFKTMKSHMGHMLDKPTTINVRI